MLFNPAAVALYRSFKKHEDWSIEPWTAQYKNKIVVWVGNGATYFDGYPDRGTPQFLGRLERYILWFFFRRMQRRQIATLFSEE